MRTVLLAAICALATAMGTVSAQTRPAFQVPAVAGHRQPAPGEHPRLIVRKADVEALRQAAQTDRGKLIVQRIRQALRLMDKAALAGRNREVVKEAGFKVAGHGAVYLLEGDAASAAAAAEVARAEILGFPLKGSLEVADRAARLHGLVLGYDLCFDAWDQAFRAKVRAFMTAENRALWSAVGGPGGGQADSPDYMMVCGVAGLVELCLLGDSDDPAAGERLAAVEKAVVRHLDTAIAERGFGVHGEAVRQAALASGVFPFVHAHRLVTGRDLSGHPSLADALVPLIYQVVPGVGLPVFGGSSGATDRSGLVAMAAIRLPDAQRPAVNWLLKQLGGDTDQGVVRPHQGLYMLQANLGGEAVAPGGADWPRHFRGERAQVALVRSGWKDANDVVVLFHRGSLHLVGIGGRWVSAAGPHATIWSDSPGAGGVENLFLFDTHVQKNRVYRTTVQSRLTRFDVQDGGSIASLTVAMSGQVARVVRSLEAKEKVGGRDAAHTVEVPDGGPFTGQRIAGIDLTGQSGAEALVVLADRLEGGGKAPRTWTLHFGVNAKFTADGNTFTITDNGVTLQGTAILPAGAMFAGTSNPPVANFVHLDTTADEVQVILTLARDAPPKIAFAPAGLSAGVTIGRRTARLVGERILFEP